MVDTLGQIISGRRPVSELGGPLKIAQVSGEQVNRGLEDFIFFMAMISINLGFINLLPIPMLDGGHLLFYGIEAIQRKPVSPMVQEWARSEEHTSELQSLMRISYAVFCLTKKTHQHT